MNMTLITFHSVEICHNIVSINGIYSQLFLNCLVVIVFVVKSCKFDYSNSMEWNSWKLFQMLIKYIAFTYLVRKCLVLNDTSWVFQWNYLNSKSSQESSFGLIFNCIILQYTVVNASEYFVHNNRERKMLCNGDMLFSFVSYFTQRDRTIIHICITFCEMEVSKHFTLVHINGGLGWEIDSVYESLQLLDNIV